MKASAGYSGTPLPKKLGMDKHDRISILNAPTNYVRALRVNASETLQPNSGAVQFFTKSRKELELAIPKLRSSILPDGAIWISWPKKSSKVQTDLDENIVREIALAHELVDVKVCAVDEVWSGLKLVIPVALRKINR
ncbi:MAG: DUF3052 family protein [Acidobacteriaceae bacterium]